MNTVDANYEYEVLCQKFIPDPSCPKPPRRRYEEVFASPLLQIFSASVSTKFDECEIYGVIRATELKDNTVFDLYNRDPSEYETIPKNGTLSLTGPEGDAILGNTGVTIDLCLKDKTRNIELIKGKHYLDCVRDDSRDRLMKAVIHGEYGSVCLYYTTFRFAVYAIVEVALCKDPNTHGGFDDVHGSLVAYYGNNTQYCDTADELKLLETNLFDKPSDKPVKVTDKVPFKLLRSTLAVPAYSSLVIDMKLSTSQGRLTGGIVELGVGIDSFKTLPIENGKIEVEVNWEIAYPRIYKESVMSWTTSADMINGIEINPDQESWKNIPKHLVPFYYTPPPDEQLCSSSNMNSESKIEGCEALEIFTVYVGGINHDISTLYGSIKVDGGCGYVGIFNRSRSEAEPLPDDNTVCIEMHEVITNIQFIMVLELKDPIHDLEISRSGISWHYGKVDGIYSLNWFDIRICSVARGANGYAAVHYMLIKNAVQATVEVSLIYLGSDVPPNIYGLICARYGEQEYSTEYEKVYYKSRLFNKQRHNPEKLSADNLKVRLIKSVMAVPISSSLIIEADLKLIFNDNSHEEIVYGEKEFLIDISKTTRKKIGKRACDIEVSVTFDNLDDD